MKNRVFDAFGILRILPGCIFMTDKAFLRVLGANHFLLANARGSARRDLCERLADTKSLLGRLVGLNGAIRYRCRGGPSVSKWWTTMRIALPLRGGRDNHRHHAQRLACGGLAWPCVELGLRSYDPALSHVQVSSS